MKKIIVNKQGQNALLEIIDQSTFKGRDLYYIASLRRAIENAPDHEPMSATVPGDNVETVPEKNFADEVDEASRGCGIIDVDDKKLAI